MQAIKENNLTVSAIGTGQAYVDDRIYFTSIDKKIRSAAVQRIKDQIDLASKLNSKVIIGTIKGPLPEDKDDRVIAVERATACLKECTEYAKYKKVNLVLEAINRYETNFFCNRFTFGYFSYEYRRKTNRTSNKRIFFLFSIPTFC